MRVITGSARGRRLFGPKSDRIRPAIDKVKQAVFNILGDVTGLKVLDLFAGTGSMGIEALSRGAAHATFVDNLPEALQLIKKNLEMCSLLDQAIIIKSLFKLDRHSEDSPSEPRPLARFVLRTHSRCAPAPCSPGEPRNVDLKNYGLIFVDPPYDKGLVNPTLAWISNSERVLVGTDLLRPTKRSERFDKELSDEGFGGREGSPPEYVGEKLLAPSGIVVVEHSPRELPKEVTGLELFDQRKYGQTLVSFLKGT